MYKSSWLTLFWKNHFNFGGRPIDQYVIFECKYLFSIIIFNFIESDKVQDRFHTHAFNSVSFKLKGYYEEHILDENGETLIVPRHNVVKFFERDIYHAIGKSNDCWTLLLAGPWKQTWKEFFPNLRKIETLSWSRKTHQLC